MSEVLAALDAIAQGATEYHGVLGYFPNQSYGSTNLAHFSDQYAAISLVNGTDTNYDMNIVAAFNANLDLTDGAGFGQLTMQVIYNTTGGYGKHWDLAQTTIDAVYIPK